MSSTARAGEESESDDDASPPTAPSSSSAVGLDGSASAAAASGGGGGSGGGTALSAALLSALEPPLSGLSSRLVELQEAQRMLVTTLTLQRAEISEGSPDWLAAKATLDKLPGARRAPRLSRRAHAPRRACARHLLRSVRLAASPLPAAQISWRAPRG
jgi:hypothetical protein